MPSNTICTRSLIFVIQIGYYSWMHDRTVPGNDLKALVEVERHGHRRASNLGGLQTFSSKDQRDLESSQKRRSHVLLFFQKSCPNDMDVYPTEGGYNPPAAPLRVNEGASEWRIKWMCELVSAWVGEWVSEWVSEWVGGWVSGWVSEWVGEWESEWVCECVSEWVYKWRNDWITEWRNEWINE